ncbi:helix-turn-helix domain-containing protein [Rhizobium sp. AP16]|uniref:helix-turn-helix domain-containing protein n=1 Tax=Rhizobium sp. AP16 TaxID=1144306 RepID=UPI00026ED82B|nr:helix-turn-helix domain-containing protein [Rhizobium sp. AP16]EJK83310.1 response regulator with CheY-like receiver, AAA-type ATPase, and DNA-binding domain [Rhizobium sp. AP16]
MTHSSPWESREFSEAAFPVKAQVARALLNIVFGELEAMFVVDNRLPLPFSLEDSPEPYIAISRGDRVLTACVTIDLGTGLYVFKAFDRETSVVLTTRVEERLIDQIVAHLGGSDENPTPRTIEQSVDMLIGQTIADVERNLILQTLRRCSGNPTRAAFMLGIPLEALGDKLAVYFGPKPKGGSASAEGLAH